MTVASRLTGVGDEWGRGAGAARGGASSSDDESVRGVGKSASRASTEWDYNEGGGRAEVIRARALPKSPGVRKGTGQAGTDGSSISESLQFTGGVNRFPLHTQKVKVNVPGVWLVRAQIQFGF